VALRFEATVEPPEHAQRVPAWSVVTQRRCLELASMQRLHLARCMGAPSPPSLVRTSGGGCWLLPPRLRSHCTWAIRLGKIDMVPDCEGTEFMALSGMLGCTDTGCEQYCLLYGAVLNSIVSTAPQVLRCADKCCAALSQVLGYNEQCCAVLCWEVLCCAVLCCAGKCCAALRSDVLFQEAT
jgi:hypothetical protein